MNTASRHASAAILLALACAAGPGAEPGDYLHVGHGASGFSVTYTLFLDPGRLFACALVQFGAPPGAAQRLLQQHATTMPSPPVRISAGESAGGVIDLVPWHLLGTHELSPAEYRYTLRSGRRTLQRSIPLVPWSGMAVPGPLTESLRERSLYLSMQ